MKKSIQSDVTLKPVTATLNWKMLLHSMFWASACLNWKAPLDVILCTTRPAWLLSTDFCQICSLIHKVDPFCSVLDKSHLGAKRDFEIWAFKVFFFGHQKHPLEWLLEAQTWISKLVRIHRRFLTMHELGSSASVGLKKWGGSTYIPFQNRLFEKCSGKKPYWCWFQKKQHLNGI